MTIPHPHLSVFNAFLCSLNEENEEALVDIHSKKEFGVTGERQFRNIYGCTAQLLLIPADFDITSLGSIPTYVSM